MTLSGQTQKRQGGVAVLSGAAESTQTTTRCNSSGGGDSRQHTSLFGHAGVYVPACSSCCFAQPDLPVIRHQAAGWSGTAGFTRSPGCLP